MPFRIGAFAALAIACVLLAAQGAPAAGQAAQDSNIATFAKLAAQLTSARDNGDTESETTQEQALQILDRAALAQLNSAGPNLDALNMQLAAFVIHQPPVGEGYILVRLGGTPAGYALLANFGLGGPSAIRLYSGAPGHISLAARIDRYAQKDLFDDYMEIVPIAGSEPVFVTVAGRTDEMQTGVFSAWRFDGSRVQALWTSDILENSSYQSAPNGFLLTYCADADSSDTGACAIMRRDRFVWQDGMWKRAETSTFAAAASAK